MTKLSVVYSTRNEEANIGASIESIKAVADEVIVVDEYSTDKTQEVAESLGAKVYQEPHQVIFHITKQKAIDRATGDWILQLDADERVSPKLASEIKKVMSMSDREITKYEQDLKERELFERHMKVLGLVNNTGEYSAFFVPRLNYFLGKYLKYGGVYPDGVIRLFKRGKARLPGKDVHEQMQVDGKIGWLQGPLFHFADTSFTKYLKRNSYYIDLITNGLKANKMQKSIFNFINYVFVKPISWFFWTQIRHKGILDGWQGMLFSFFSALRFPRAYFRYILNK
jgi:glycosyltransferase involved in cell wall biosynthesis